MIEHWQGHTSDFTMVVKSMQIEHDKIEEAKTGDDIGIKLPEHARTHDKVFLVTE